MKKVLIFWYNFMYKFTEAILCFGMGLNQMKSVLHKYPTEMPFTSFFASKHLPRARVFYFKSFWFKTHARSNYKRSDTRWFKFERPHSSITHLPNKPLCGPIGQDGWTHELRSGFWVVLQNRTNALYLQIEVKVSVRYCNIDLNHLKMITVWQDWNFVARQL